MQKLMAFLLVALVPFAGWADMAAMKSVKTEEIVNASENKAVKALAILAKDAFSIRTISIFEGQLLKSIPASTVSDSIDEAILTLDWATVLSPGARDLLTKDRELLKGSLGDQSYSWLWIQNQLGEGRSVKPQLTRLFDEEYRRVMAMQETNFGPPSLMKAEALHKALRGLSKSSENKAVEEKLRKMKSHVSTLPDSGIMT